MTSVSSQWLCKRAKALRREMTPQERILWRLLRDGELSALNWRRQIALGEFIADFVSHPARLIVEVDGAQHGEPKQLEHDAKRTAWFNIQGYRVVRFWSFEIKQAQNEVWLTIHAAALQSPARLRMERWRSENAARVAQAYARLPLDGGGGRLSAEARRAKADEAAGGGARTGAEEDASGGSTGEVRGSHPLSHASRDSSPIEGERR